MRCYNRSNYWLSLDGRESCKLVDERGAEVIGRCIPNSNPRGKAFVPSFNHAPA